MPMKLNYMTLMGFRSLRCNAIVTFNTISKTAVGLGTYVSMPDIMHVH